jgi:hypothetical protein
MPKAYLSIDFEDIAHDFKREFAIPHDGTLRIEALWRAYEVIERFCREDAGGARLTFFTTGILADKCPEIVARIASDGHEIACHYYYHDMASADPPAAFEANLRRAVDALEDAGGQKVLGFRAPRFSLRPEDVAHFLVLEKLFAYDSSVTVASRGELAAFRAAASLQRLALVPVARQKVLPGLPPMRPGGAYLKLFPASVTLRGLRMAATAGLVPLLYLHPYEFVADRSFYFPMREMGDLALRRRLFLWARQTHCNVIGNRGLAGKLRRILEGVELGGPMRDLLAPAPAR